jgi:adenosine deaminase
MPSPESPANTLALARALPKVLLHEHLDGGLRVQTLLALARRRGIATPADLESELARWFDDNAHAGSLVKYLEGFALTVSAMADEAALEQVAFEAAEDALAEGAVLAEFRIAPLLFEPLGVPGDAAVAAMLRGLARSALPSGLIVCAIRNHDPALAVRAAELARRWMAPAGGGPAVVGFDLAGAEFGHPPTEHASALAVAREAGLALTLHAGEADAAERVLEAVRLGALRIGHGVRLADALADPTRRHLVDEVVAAGVHLEVCPTSNVHTGAARSIAEHPIVPLWQAGVSLSYHTDNRLMSCLTHSDEAAALLGHTALTTTDLLAMTRQAAAASFLPAGVREAALAQVDRGAAALLARELEPGSRH